MTREQYIDMIEAAYPDRGYKKSLSSDHGPSEKTLAEVIKDIALRDFAAGHHAFPEPHIRESREQMRLMLEGGGPKFDDVYNS